MKNVFRFTDEFTNHEKMILRDHLALVRTKLANERTLFSYIRTALYLLTAGIGVLQIDSIRNLHILAWLSIATGLVIFCIGIYRFFQVKNHLKSYYVTPDN